MIAARTFLGFNPDEWVAIGTVATALVALAAGLVAWRQLVELRRTRDDQARPYVVVDIQPDPVSSHFFDLVVENIGQTAARNVRIEFDPKLQQNEDRGHPLAESALVRDGIAMLPPRRRITALLDSAPNLLKGDLPMSYNVRVSLSDARGRAQPDQDYVIDLNYLSGLRSIREYGSHDAAKALVEMEKRLSRWTGGQGELRVLARDRDAEMEEELAIEVLTGQRPSLGHEAPADWKVWLVRNPVVRDLVMWIRTKRGKGS